MAAARHRGRSMLAFGLRKQTKLPRRFALMTTLALTAGLVSLVGSAPGSGAEPLPPTVTTDKADYQPEEIVTITGTGFAPGVAYDVPVIRPDGSIVLGDGTFEPGHDTITSDSSGSFTYQYQLNGIIGDYEVRVYPSPWSGDRGEVPLAATMFTDAVRFEQCANGPVETPNRCAAPDKWTIQSLRNTIAHYYEGNSVPARLLFTGLVVNSVHTVVIEWDTRTSGRQAFDFITSFNRTVDAVGCVGATGCATASVDTFPIPTDPAVTGAGVTHIPGVFTAFNGDITAVGPYTYGTGKTKIAVTFTALTANPVLAWGAHIATEAAWGIDNTAVTLPLGTLYKSRLDKVDGVNGNMERTLNNNAVQLDSAPPLCALTKRTPAGIEVTVQDTTSGLQSVVVTKSVNATVTVPPFTAGSTEAYVITGTKNNLSNSSQVALKVTDTSGNTVACDPVMTVVIASTGKPVTQTFTELPEAERYVTVWNGQPGLSSLSVTANGRSYKMGSLAPGEQRTLDIGSALKPGDTNTVSLTAAGKPGTSGDVMISDILP